MYLCYISYLIRCQCLILPDAWQPESKNEEQGYRTPILDRYLMLVAHVPLVFFMTGMPE